MMQSLMAIAQLDNQHHLMLLFNQQTNIKSRKKQKRINVLNYKHE